MRRWLLAAILSTALVGGTAGVRADTAALEKAARKEGEITWYVASLEAGHAEAAGRAFTAKHGIKVNVVRAPSQVIFQRLTQDLSQKAHLADVFSALDLGIFAALKEQGALSAYKPANAAHLFPAFRAMDKDGMFHATVASAIVIGYNTDKLRPEQVPRSWPELLGAQWSGQLALGHPGFGGFAGSWAVQMHKLYGRGYFERLRSSNPYVSRSVYDAVEVVALGKRVLVPAPAAMVLAAADDGKPLAVQYPSDGAVLVATPSAILRNAPHPNAARLFIEFLLGPEFGRILVDARFEPMRPEIKPRPGAKSIADINAVQPGLQETIKGIPQVADLWRALFDQK